MKEKSREKKLKKEEVVVLVNQVKVMRCQQEK
jgi:hypothetical protein